MDEPGGGLDTWHRIEILMQEYRTLREEIASRVNARFAIVGYLGAVGTYVLVETDASDSLILPLVIWDLSVGAKQVLPLAVLLLLALWLRLGQLIRRCSLRIAEIEDKVNHLAGGELLVWESRNKQHGLFHKLFRVLEKTTAQPKRRT